MKKIEIKKPEEFLKLIELNKNNYLYHDHPTDGLDLFTDEIVENYGYHAIAFDFITYANIANFIENNCEGTFTFNNHPMGFSGFAVVDDIKKVREQVKEYIVNEIQSNKLDELDSDQKLALKIFNVY